MLGLSPSCQNHQRGFEGTQGTVSGESGLVVSAFEALSQETHGSFERHPWSRGSL